MNEMIAREFFLFNTVNTINASTSDPSALDDAVALCERYEHLFSCYDPQSELYQLNQSGAGAVSVDPELAAFIDTSLDYCRETEGLFDITMGAITKLWDFKNQVAPSPDSISAALSHVDYRHVCVSGSTVRLDDPDTSLDVGGIAKGYIADGILALLRKHDIDCAMVNLGGNVAVMGGKPDGSPWNIGIRNPVSSSAVAMLESFASVSLHDGSVVTSGIYERAFESDDTFYHHILDPRTGYPAKTDILGATVVSDTSLDGDGLTTALVIMGADKALQFAEARPGIDMLLITEDGDVLGTSGIGEKIPFKLLK